MRTRLNVPLNWLRHRGLDPSDVFLASYPRSGQHWTRFQLFEILTHQPADFDGLDNTIPKIGEHSKAPAILPAGRRLIQTHEPWRKEYKRAILLVRDCRDIVLSEYAWGQSLDLNKHFDIIDFDGFLLSWLQARLQRMGSWQNHVHAWLDSPALKSGNVLMIKFEDMRKNPESALVSMLEFLDVAVDLNVVRAAISNNSIEKMRAKEDNSRKYDPKRLGRKPGEEYRFVRQGSIGGWRERLTNPQVNLIEQYAGTALARLGYSVGDCAAERASRGLSEVSC
jgi:hypothetical protein